MSKTLSTILLVLCLGAFVAGLAWLFVLRFESGDVYPEYSSLRADPLGAMAFCESLKKLPGMTVQRDYTTQNRLPEEKGVTYLHLAAPVRELDFFSEDTVKEIEGFVIRGGRLVITLYPQPVKRPLPWFFEPESESETNKVKAKKTDQETRSDQKDSDSDNSPEEKPEPSKKKLPNTDDEGLPHYISLEERWGAETDFENLQPGKNDVYKPAQVQNETGLPLPATLDWHSAIVFTNLNSSWHTIYARGTNAVLIERHYGSGSVVIATDSYFLSNEALWKDRHADLLAWLVGTNRHVVFDEAHFGITETSGVATLMRKYRLHGLMAGLILLAGLFIWKNSFSLLPSSNEHSRQPFVAGKDAAAGFVNLLRRNVPADELLRLCFAEWKKSCPPQSPQATARAQQAQALLEAESAAPRRERNPVATYRRICETLKSSELRVPGSGFRVESSESQSTTHNEEGKAHEHNSI